MKTKRNLILNCLLGAVLLALPAVVQAQTVADLNGNYSVTESWSVTVYLGNGTSIVPKTYTGKETGTLAITNGTYTQINDSGVADISRLHTSRTIDYDGTYYDINGGYPFSAEAGGPGGFYAIVQLTYFVIKVPVGSTGGFSLGDAGLSSPLDVSGTSLASLTGTGTYVDGNNPDPTVGYINEVDDSSTSSLNLPVVAPTITTPPVSQVVMAGSDVSFSVGASGAASFTYEWKHGGTKLSNSGEFSGTATSTLNINNAQTKDAGGYTVVVSDTKGSSSAPATLTVETTQPFTNLYSFTGGSDGGYPDAGLILSGNTLYGTADIGGASSNGTVFAVNTDGTGFTNLYSFSALFTNSMGVNTNSDGARPQSSLILSGNTLYGTASGGGASGYGTVFAVNTDGTGFTNLYNFTAINNYINSDGANPAAGLVLSDNTLYGTASEGGSSGNGTVFAVNTDGTGFTNLYNFTAINNYINSDGANPAAGLILSGNTLYGTASEGGSSGNGTVFAVNTDGTGFTNLYNFTAINNYINSDGANPAAGLILSGNTLYGTASEGGSSGNGTVFALNTDGTGFTNLYNFTAINNYINSDGANPAAGLILSGNTLYGTASEGGSSGNGTVFALNTDGTGFTTWYNFTGGSDGYSPQAGLILSGDTLYGTAQAGGTNANGTVFSLYVGVASATQGSLQVTIAPPGAVSAGAEWQVDAGTYQKSAATVANLSAGAHTVSFKSISGWNTPLSQMVTITNGTTTTDVGIYEEIGNPTLTITAPKANEKWSNSDFTVTGTAKDNVGVSNVLASLNNGGWTAATLSNGGSNWTADVMLTPGTNTIAAYAEDTSGNLSTTDTVSFVYILSATLTVQTNGDGSVTPNDNGTLLQIGKQYSLKAEPAKGFGLVNWTDGEGNVLTNGVTLDFIMASNLTFVANFKDITPPTLKIVAPTLNEKWSNADFTVTGTAKDNVGVSNVLVSLNHGAWASATLSDGGSNWTEGVTLMPGTNTIAVYAVGTGDNLSTTDKVSIVYILSATLTVQTNGDGTVTPNDNGALLQIGKQYSLKAVAAKGSGFIYWSGSVPMSDDSTLNFTMASNLTIIANFKDVTPPVATITLPTTNQKWSNSIITATGKASDNVGVDDVWVQMNGGGWAEAGTLNAFTNWNATNLTVIAGTNLVQAYAVDGAGNVSVTNEVKFIGVLPPTALAGYVALVKPSGGQSNIVVSWGDGTWAQAGADNDTNEDDYAAGSYTYMKTGPDTALLTNVDIGMMNALGTTNVSSMNLTFISATSANYTWSGGYESGSGTMTFSPASNLVPASLGGKTVQLDKNGVAGPKLALTGDGTFTSTEANGAVSSGTYTLSQYSPTVAIIQQNFTDPNDAGALGYVELDFTAAAAGNGFGCYYGNPAYDINPDDSGAGTFKIQ